MKETTLEPPIRCFPSMRFRLSGHYPPSASRPSEPNVSRLPPLFRFQSFDRTSTPLKPRPNEKSEPDARFVAKPPDKFSGSEKENLFVMLEVFGDPVPRVEWYKVRIFSEEDEYGIDPSGFAPIMQLRLSLQYMCL